MSVIRTPDQRLRVFVSSTLQELLPERQAVKAAIASLQLSPVMFELGARPHPPQELYRAYLEQSHIFLGIYWQRYGWIAPGEEISGLEDEYQLCGNKPKLIYVKTPAEVREPRLNGLLAEIRNDDTASYKPFSTPEELQELVADDLALLLTERFEASLAAPPAPAPVAAAQRERPELPRPPTRLIGREAELAALNALIAQPDVQLITLLGPGGIGKSRLALALIEGVEPGRAVFVDLSNVVDPEQVLPAIAEALVLGEQEGRTALPTVQAVLDETAQLLVLDNVEQVIEAGPQLADLLEGCARLTVLTTSRTPLRLAAEREFPVAPLPTADAVELFVARAQAVRPSFAVTTSNESEIAELARRLDGLPLALELAAARTKLLSPSAMLKRLDRRFDLLEGGARDLPDRHQTLRATIEWSCQLLQPGERRVLGELAVFAGGWSLDAAEAVTGQTGDLDFFDALAGLVDDNLVVTYDGPQESRFRLLESIRAYALTELDPSERATDAVRDRHAAYFLAFAEQTREQLAGDQQRAWLIRLDTEHDNLRAALVWYRDHPAADGLARLALALTNFWWLRGHYSEGREWLQRAVAGLADDHHLRGPVVRGLGTLAWLQGDYRSAQRFYTDAVELARAGDDQQHLISAVGNLGVAAIELDELDTAQSLLSEALELARQLSDPRAIGPALINLSVVQIRRSEHDQAAASLTEAIAIFRDSGDHWRLATSLINLGDAQRSQQAYADAGRSYAESLQLAEEIGDRESIAYALEGFAGLAAAQDDGDHAARLWGAAELLRELTGNPRPPGSGVSHYDTDVARMRGLAGEKAFAEAWTAGRQAPLAEVIKTALAGQPG